ncbi:hypothetical protein NC651_023434 [Populus alba x Populus x berolinensis]|nr:hypothetical protein NC651_023434 [Populus alba x Populus x berolinensis]
MKSLVSRRRNDTNLMQNIDKIYQLLMMYAHRQEVVFSPFALLEGPEDYLKLWHMWKSKRPQAGHYSGFISQLQDFEKSLQESCAIENCENTRLAFLSPFDKVDEFTGPSVHRTIVNLNQIHCMNVIISKRIRISNMENPQ